jgi:hypothetical protein
MRKGILPKLSIGVALMGAMALAYAPQASADLGGTVTYTEPSGTLIMPYDNTEGHQSFQIISRIGDDLAGDTIATHWSFWSKDCEHLADIFVCLTPNDTTVVDPANLQNEVQTGNENSKIGGIIDLTGTKGLVVVTAFEKASGSTGCQVLDPQAVIENQIVGGWTIANVGTSSSFSHDAIGFNLDTAGFPDPAVLGDGETTFPGLKIQSFNPTTLEDSEIILLAIEFSADSGNGSFIGSEVGPLTRFFGLSNGDTARVCCNVAYVDNVESRISLPDFCFKCVGFAPIVDALAETGETAIIPPITTIDAPGYLHLTNCESQQLDPADGGPSLLGSENSDQFLFGFHGMAVGPFGAVVSGKYTNVDFF